MSRWPCRTEVFFPFVYLRAKPQVNMFEWGSPLLFRPLLRLFHSLLHALHPTASAKGYLFRPFHLLECPRPDCVGRRFLLVLLRVLYPDRVGQSFLLRLFRVVRLIAPCRVERMLPMQNRYLVTRICAREFFFLAFFRIA